MFAYSLKRIYKREPGYVLARQMKQILTTRHYKKGKVRGQNALLQYLVTKISQLIETEEEEDKKEDKNTPSPSTRSQINSPSIIFSTINSEFQNFQSMNKFIRQLMALLRLYYDTGVTKLRDDMR